MRLEDFQLLDNEPIDKSIIKRDYFKIYHQQGANLNDPAQNVEFIFGENNNYHQIRNAYLEFDITVKNPAANFDDNSEIRLMNNAFACCFKEARLSTTGGSDIEHNKYVGQTSTIMKVIMNQDGDLLSQFDNINEEIGADAATADIIRSSSLKQMLIDNHTTDANKGKIKGYLSSEHIFGFC